MPAPTYINIEYFFYQAFIFFKKAHLYIVGIDWFSVIFWAKVIAFVISAIFVAGIIYNIRGIIRTMRKNEEL